MDYNSIGTIVIMVAAVSLGLLGMLAGAFINSMIE